MSFDLVSPRWLWGLAALLVPVAIHLLSRGSSPRLRLGTTRFLVESPTRTARRLRLTERALLAARCLVLAVLVLILADPVRWRTPGGAEAPAGTLLVDPVLLERPDRFPGLTDAISERTDAGWEVGILGPGLPSLGPLPGSSSDSTPRDTVEVPRTASAAHPDLWSLAREAVWRREPGVPIEFMSSNRLVSLVGTRPSVPDEVSWRVWTNAGRDAPLNRWIESARDLDSIRPRVVLGESEVRGTSFRRALPGEVSVQSAGSARTLRLTPSALGGRPDPVSGDDSLQVSADERALRIAVVSDADRDADRTYLMAALRALADRLPWRLDIAEGLRGLPPGEAFEGIFWLSADPASEAARAAVVLGGFLFEDGGALWEDCSGWLEIRSIRIETWRCAPPPTVAEETLLQARWTLPTGRPLLSVAVKDSRLEFLFASRFHPDWSSLVGSPLFLEWLGGVLRETAPPGSALTAFTSDSDQSALAAEFLVPARGAGQTPRRRETDRSPTLALWVVVLGALALERLLAERGAGGTK